LSTLPPVSPSRERFRKWIHELPFGSHSLCLCTVISREAVRDIVKKHNTIRSHHDVKQLDGG
ncbi:hypothetical protein ACFLV0_05215, partial [Chloroflexota bacterium]